MMPCEKCKETQAGATSTYIRWDTARIEIRGCDEHLGQVFDALRKSQEATHEGRATLSLRPESWENLFDCVRQTQKEMRVDSRGDFWASIQELERQLEEMR